MQVAAREQGREAQRCPLCHAALATDASVTTCDGCGTAAHVGCIGDLSAGRCPTAGCARAQVVGVDKNESRGARVWRRARGVLAAVVQLAIVAHLAHLTYGEWRVRSTMTVLAERYQRTWPWDTERRDPADMRALAAELRALPSAVTVSEARVRLMAERLEEAAGWLEARREEEERQRRAEEERQQRDEGRGRR